MIINNDDVNTWRVYTYNTVFEQQVFGTILESSPQGEHNAKSLRSLMRVEGVLGEKEKHDIYRIVDAWMRKYMDMSEQQRFNAMYSTLRTVESWLSLYHRKPFQLDIELLHINAEFYRLLGTYQWDCNTYHSHFWNLFFPVANALYLLTDFEAGMVYGKLPPTLPLVENAEELQLCLRDLFFDELCKLCFNGTIPIGRYVTLEEMPRWKNICQIITGNTS